jgi:E3 ubiquitin-protein ligase TRIP12
VQRTALAAAANCCRNISPEHLDMLAGVWPIVRGCLGYGDPRLVESAALCVVRAADACVRAHALRLDALSTRRRCARSSRSSCPARPRSSRPRR